VFDPASYLTRIGFSGLAEPNFETLRRLHLAHIHTVPFENLDISLRRTIVCEEERFLHKIIHQRRGGFCYELNGAFAALLRTLGFGVTLLSGRFRRADGSSGPEFDHMALLVDLGEPWLADVGFGDSFLEPLRLQPDLIQEQYGHSFRITESERVMTLERREPDSDWKAQVHFALVPHQLAEYAGMCHYHQTSSDSHFTRQRICTLATPDGRITLSDLKLIRTTGKTREEKMLKDEGEWHSALEQYFGVKL
jgi:N-hydroxyarylamine O-acetyltransferase